MKHVPKLLAVILLSVASIIALLVWMLLSESFSGSKGCNKTSSIAVAMTTSSAQAKEDQAAASDEEPEAVIPMTAEEQAVADAEATVESFDVLIDKWSDPAENAIELKAVREFVASFHGLPKDRREGCLHRALNLIPDENVMLLAGILMDKTMDKEIVETVFNDILNRDEDVKVPIMKEIYKDKSHPCWADAAWILDVTGEMDR